MKAKSRDFALRHGLKATMETWRRFLRMRGPDRALVCEAAIALTLNWLGLRLIGFRGWKAVLARLSRGTTNHAGCAATATFDSAQAIARRTESAARHLFFKTNCLEQSGALWWMLLRRGIEAELHAGAKKEGEQFEAHAWVECCGVALNDPGDGGEFASFNAPLIPMKAQIP